MKIICYCQHVLGIGHFHRSLEICKALSREHDVVMVLGGPDVKMPDTDIRFFQLPGLMMDSNFSQLIPCDPGQDLAAVKKSRKELLYNFCRDFAPDIFLVELFPFGRKAFGFELNPVLADMANGKLPGCTRICSLRDILVEKKDKNKYENRVINSLNNSFDGLLIHSDPGFIPLENSFSSMEKIEIPVKYTGFVTPKPKFQGKSNTIRRQLRLSVNDKLIVASIGGGNVGAELLQAVAAAASLTMDKHLYFHLFTGPYSAPELLEELQSLHSSHLQAHGFCDNFPEWLQAADLSISMAGYNTCMNLLQASIPALLYPFAQNREQRMRVTAFANDCAFSLLEKDELNPAKLAHLISRKLKKRKAPNKVDLNGAAKSSELIGNINLWKE